MHVRDGIRVRFVCNAWRRRVHKLSRVARRVVPTSPKQWGNSQTFTQTRNPTADIRGASRFVSSGARFRVHVYIRSLTSRAQLCPRGRAYLRAKYARSVWQVPRNTLTYLTLLNPTTGSYLLRHSANVLPTRAVSRPVPCCSTWLSSLIMIHYCLELSLLKSTTFSFNDRVNIYKGMDKYIREKKVGTSNQMYCKM